MWGPTCKEHFGLKVYWTWIHTPTHPYLQPFVELYYIADVYGKTNLFSTTPPPHLHTYSFLKLWNFTLVTVTFGVMEVKITWTFVPWNKSTMPFKTSDYFITWEKKKQCDFFGLNVVISISKRVTNHYSITLVLHLRKIVYCDQEWSLSTLYRFAMWWLWVHLGPLIWGASLKNISKISFGVPSIVRHAY